MSKKEAKNNQPPPADNEAAQVGSPETKERNVATHLFLFCQFVDRHPHGDALGEKDLVEFTSKGELDEWLKNNPSVKVLKIIRGFEKKVKIETKVTLL